MTDFYRTPQGDHRHATWYCARKNQRPGAPEPTKLAAAEIANWAPCADCCDAETVAAATPVAAPATCRNSGVKDPRRMGSTCLDCGKEGTVNRRTGTLRKHAPANA